MLGQVVGLTMSMYGAEIEHLSEAVSASFIYYTLFENYYGGY